MSTTHKVTLLNRDGKTIEVYDQETILDAAEDHGLVLPYACRYGGCITCAARLIKGEVDQSEAVGLKDYMLKAGYVLTCVSYPRSDCELKVGVDSHDEGLYRNPFRELKK